MTLEPLARAVAGGERIEAVLWLQCVACRAAPQARSDDAPARVAVEHAVGVGGLVGAVEGAHAKMHDPRSHLLPIIRRLLHRLRQAAESFLAELRHGVSAVVGGELR
jgi:hypothetical protein